MATPRTVRAGGPSTREIARVFVTVLLLAVLCVVLYAVRSTIYLLFIGAFVALALGPSVARVQRQLRLPRAAAILLVYLLLLGAVFVVGLLIVPPVVDQVDGLAQDIPHYLQDLRDNDTFRKYDEKYDITEKLTDQAQKLPSKLGDAASALSAVTVGVFGAALKLITVLTVAFFLLLDGGRVVRFLLDQVPPRHRNRVGVIAGDVYRSVAGYVGGTLAIALLAGVLTYVVLTILGVPFAVPLAVLMGFLDLIPLVGATLGGVLIGFVTLFNDFPTATIVWIAFNIAYQQFENSVIQPFVYRRTVNLHPLAVITAILVGAALLGVLGALIAIPVAASIQIVVKDWWAYRTGGLAGLDVAVAGGSLDVPARQPADAEQPGSDVGPDHGADL